MYELALFAGAGGGCLATQHLLGWHTLGYVENASYPVAVLKQRIKDGILHDAPIWGDIRTFRADNPECGEFISALGRVDGLCITAGFPCQPFSSAGKRRGADDPRNMWPGTVRVIREVKPGYVFLENVPGLLAGSHGYFGQILGELASCGYDARWRVLSAAEMGAPHKRDRLWVVAHAASKRGWWQCGREPRPSNGYQKQNLHKWKREPGYPRMVDGVAYRMDRLAAIGNGQVPAVAATVWEMLTAPIEG